MTREKLEFPWSTQKTIENLKELKVILQKRLKRKNYEGQGERDSKEIGIDFDMAIEALEKQIPKKPVDVITKDNEFICMICPACEQVAVEFNDKFCRLCGQALDWTEPYKEGET